MNRRILLVDDDHDILSAYQRNLRKFFTISIAYNGMEGIEIIKDSEAFAAIVSDYNMPKMNGIDFLINAKLISPDSSRIIITGNADLSIAIESVNQGNIFRFLTKPISTESLIKTLESAIEQYRLINAEKELLDKTLKGSIKILIDILSIVSPSGFGQASRLRKITKAIAEIIKYPKIWEVEIATLLSLIGYVTLPVEIINKRIKNEPFTPEEEIIFASHYENGKNLLKNIPRLEEIAYAISLQNKNYSDINKTKDTITEKELPFISRILKIAIDYDNLIQSGKLPRDAFNLILLESFKYDPMVLNSLEKIVTGQHTERIAKSISFRNLRIGMILIEDLKDEKGNVLIKKGNEITDILLMRLINASKVRRINEPIRIIE